jgi:hypothetical protein
MGISFLALISNKIINTRATQNETGCEEGRGGRMDSLQVRKAVTLVASIAFLLSVSLLAQGNLGRIIGSVTDQSGGRELRLP